MATPQEVKNQAELLDLATQYADQLKFIVKEQKEKYTLDSLSVSLANQLVKNVQSVSKEFESSKDIIKEINKQQGDFNKLILQQQTLEKSIGDEGKKRIEDYKTQENKLKDLKSQLQELRTLESEGVKVNQNKIKELSKAIIEEGKSLAANQKLLTSEEKQVMILNDMAKAYQTNARLLGEELDKAKEYEEEQARRQQNLIKSQSLVTAAVSGTNNLLKKMGMETLANKLGFEKAAKVAKEMTEKMTDGGKTTLGFFGRMRVAGAALGTILKAALNPLTLLIAGVALFAKLFQKAKEAAAEGEEFMKRMSEQSTGLARSLGISQSNAEKLAGSARAIGGSMGMTSDMATRSAGEIYGAMKGVETLSGSTMKTFMQLNVYAGVSAETLDEMHKMAKLTGEDAGTLANNMANTAAQSIKAYKVNVSQKEVMAGVAKQSNELKLNFGGSAEGIAKAFVKAKSLGFELEKMKNIAQSLLNIEDSIAAEMEAELLTGKELNLEKAREAALNHDTETLMTEIAKNYGSIEDFQKMNVLQQEAAAKAMGMNSEELANVLAGTKQNKSENQELLDVQKQGVAAMSSMASLGEKLQAMEEAKQASRAKESALMLKLKEIFHEIDQILRPIYSEIFVGIFNVVKIIAEEFKKFLQDMGGVGKEAGLIKGFMTDLGEIVRVIAQTFFSIAKVTLPIIAKGVKGIASIIKTARDGIKEFFKLFQGGNKDIDKTKALIGGIAMGLIALIGYYKAINLLQKFGNTTLGSKIKLYLQEKGFLGATKAQKAAELALDTKINALNARKLTQKQLEAGFGGKILKDLALERAAIQKNNAQMGIGNKLKNFGLSLLKKETYQRAASAVKQKAINVLDTAGNKLKALGNGLLKAGQVFQKKGLMAGLANLMSGVFSYAVTAAKAVAGIPIVGPILAAAALGAAVAGGMMLYNKAKSQKADDLYSGGGYGSRTLLGPEGAIRLNNKDSVIAGTNLFDKGKGGGGGSDPALVAEMQAIKSILQQILTKEGAVMIDGNKVGSTLALASYKTQ